MVVSVRKEARNTAHAAVEHLNDRPTVAVLSEYLADILGRNIRGFAAPAAVSPTSM